jgi:hypothetical protein
MPKLDVGPILPKAGDRVRFTGIWDRYPDVFVNSGETGVVVENSLNEVQPTLFVRPDSPELRQMVKEWDELIHVFGPIHPGEGWNDNAPLIRLDDERPLMQLP